MFSVLLRIIIIGFFLNFTTSNVYAGICDLSGSGIGGTGSPIPNQDNSGIGGTGAPTHKNGDSGIGGTGTPVNRKNGSGIGGTGIIANDSGIGGTGQKTDHQAGIIIGTITGFGSICVNGIEIHYSDSTPVSINGETGKVELLAIGQVVSVNVIGTGNEVQAQDINVINVVAGPITDIETASNRVTVLGQQVQLSAKTQFSAGTTAVTDIQNLQKGNFIQVSGLREADGNIIASRVEKTVEQNIVHIRGTATDVTAGRFKVGNMTIETKDHRFVNEGQEITVNGEIVDGKIIAKNLVIPTLKDNQRLNIEGYVRIDGDQDQIKIGHLTVEASDQIKHQLQDLDHNQKIIIEGTARGNQALEALNLIINHHLEQNEIGHDESKEEDEFQDRHDQEENEKSHLHKEDDDDEIDLPKKLKDEVEPIESHQSEIETKEPEEVDEIEPPEIEESDDEVETDEVEIPESEDPEVPEVESEEIELPEIEENEVEAPEEIEVPEVEEPEEVEVPEVETPEEVEVPEIETPEEVEVPEIETPEEVEVPEIETPEEVEVPEIETPEEVEVPEIETPEEVEVPEIESPEEIEVPEIEEPDEVDVPEIETSETEDIE